MSELVTLRNLVEDYIKIIENLKQRVIDLETDNQALINRVWELEIKTPMLEFRIQDIENGEE